MPITAADIKLMQPERLTDESDGGGSMTGLPVIDAEINNLFEDISRINRTYGNVSLRKAFLKVDTASADLYLDSHAIISAQPADPNVSGLIFTTDNFYDERGEARQRIESFVIAGAKTGLRLRGNQNQGQRSIIAYSGVSSTPAPASGDTLMLQSGEDVNTRQFVKVTEVIETNEIFTYTRQEGGNTAVKNFPVRQWIISISTELERDYPNIDPHPYNATQSDIYDTTPSVSAKYYGTTELAEAITEGATSIKVAETFAPIIPTASSETATIDQKPGGLVDTFIPTSTPITLTVNTNVGEIYLPTGILPGSIEFNASGIAFKDKNERFERDDATTTGFEQVQIDYAGGVISILEETLGSTSQSFTYTPAAVRTLVPHTGSIPIGDNNRNFNYVLQLNAKPARRTFTLAYQYLNKWYLLRDDGAGNLIGDGSGQVNYTTGSVAITLVAQPDANSVLFYQWTDRDDYEAGEGSAFSGTAPTKIKLENNNITPGSIVINWTESSVAKTATDDGNGLLQGDATGAVSYAWGQIEINGLPDSGTDWDIDYTYNPPAQVQTDTIAIAANSNRSNVTLTLSAGNVQPGSLNFSLTKYQRKTVKRLIFSDWVRWRDILMTFTDDGNGNVLLNGVQGYGTINYTTGVITLTGTAILDETTKGKERWEQ